MIEDNSRYFVTNEDIITVFENNCVNLKLHDGKYFENLEPKMLFPISNCYKYITLLGADGKERAVIRELSDLNADSEKVIKDSLDSYYFVPVIEHIFSVTMKNGIQNWNVKTNRGINKFEVRDRNHNVRVYRDGSVRIKDSADNRYIIKNYNDLDSHSIHQIISDL